VYGLESVASAIVNAWACNCCDTAVTNFPKGNVGLAHFALIAL